MAGQTLSKTSFFAALERLDHLDDTDDEGDELSAGHVFKPIPMTPKALPALSSVVSTTKSSTPASLARAHSDPQSSACYERSQGLEPLKHVKGNDRRVISRQSNPAKPNSVQRSYTTGSMPGTKAAGPASKKRKVSSVKVVPEDKQIFKNLVFFFFPNNYVSTLRRLRIQRAQEHGAQWAREWSSDITHVIIDKDLSYQDLVIHLKLASVPEDMVIVSDSYPPECLKYSTLISPSQARFRVAGAPLSTGVALPTKSVAAKPQSTDLPPLKKSRRELQMIESSQASIGSNSDTMHTTEVVVTAAGRTRVDEGSEGTSVASREATGVVSRERDALDDIIDEAKAIIHLPIDAVDFPDGIRTDDSGNESAGVSDSELVAKVTETAKCKAPAGSWAQSFSCMQQYDPNAQLENPNSRTIEVLQQMLDYYTRNADHWHILGYRKAIAALRRQSQKITTRAQAKAIAGIGPRIADKIEEIVLTSNLRQLDNTSETEEDRVIQEFLGIYGVGLRQASDWVAQGYRSLSDLRDRAPLTKNQQIGVDRYHDFSLRIPRKEVEAHGEIVRQAVQRADKEMQVIIAGSYRRGAVDSGDIDCLITKPDATLEQIRSLMVNVVVPRLFRDGFLQVGLATSKRHDHDGSKWHGASSLPKSKIWRRIDLLFVPGDEFGAALLYFTGNDIFNRSMRLLARKKGLCLNQRGLFANVLRDSKQMKTNPGRLLEGRNEERIFALLGVPWRPPEHRIC